MKTKTLITSLAVMVSALANAAPSVGYQAATNIAAYVAGVASNNLDLAKQDRIHDYTTTNAVLEIVSSQSVTNKGAVAEANAYTDAAIQGVCGLMPNTVTNIAGKVVSNVVTKAFVKDLVISAGMDTNAVQAIIQRNIETNLLCTIAASQAMTNNIKFAQLKSKPYTLSGYGITDAYTTDDADNKFLDKGYCLWLSGYLNFYSGHGIILKSWENLKVGNNPIRYESITEYLAFGDWNIGLNKFARMSDMPSTNGFIKSSEAASVAEYVFSSKGPTDIGAYPNASGQQLASQVATQGAHLNAEDAQFISTNYDSNVNLPEAYVRIKLQQGGTNVWRTIWDEMRRWNAFCGVGFDWQTWGGFHTWSTNILAMIDETSPKEYAFYDGVTGEVSPDGFFWISQPRIGICAGAAYQRHLDAGNAVWILESNGLTANIGGTTNGYFRISDEEGNTQFEIVKGDKQTVPAKARSIRSEKVIGVTHWFCDYAVTNAIAPPVAKFCRDLGANPRVWYPDTDASCPCNVTWTQGANGYTLEFWPKSNEPQMFCKAEYDRGGETIIRQSAPTEMQYIILNGTKYGLVPKTVNGELVMGLTTGN